MNKFGPNYLLPKQKFGLEIKEIQMSLWNYGYTNTNGGRTKRDLSGNTVKKEKRKDKTSLETEKQKKKKGQKGAWAHIG